MKTSISKKLIFLLTLSAIVFLTLFTTSFFLTSYKTTKSSYVQSLQNIANILSENLIASIDFEDPQAALMLLKTLETDTNIDGAFVIKDSDVFSSYSSKHADHTVVESKFRSVYKSDMLDTPLKYVSNSFIIVSSPVMLNKKCIAIFSIVANTENLHEIIERELYTLAFIFVLIIILIVFIASRLKKIFTDPIVHLKNVMQTIEKDRNYNVYIENDRNDEFSVLFDGFNKMLEQINNQTVAMNKQKDFVQTVLDSQEQIIITTNGKELVTANETFFDFFAVDTVDEFMSTYDAKCICNTFNTQAPEGYLQIKMQRESWIDYVISRSFGHTHRAMIKMGNTNFIFSVTAAKLPGDDGIKSAVFTNITEMENAKLEVEAIHKHTKESIEYASLIQGALIPDNKVFRKYFKDYFVVWHPKDTIGGDIYLFEELRHDDECLLMVIDCTGHGVPGAFVTMLVKAIERQLTAKINNSDEIVSPAKILSIFNKSMKHLLKQENADSISNAGFDGGIIYYNKKDKIIKFAGAETPLFYTKDNELKMIKGDRYSVGYKKCALDYEYTEHIIEVEEGMNFYITTDGYLDQNGGEKSFPFGKKRFKQLIKEYNMETMADQQELFLNELAEYQDEEETNDDVTLISFTV